MHKSGYLEELEISNFLNIGQERKRVGLEEMDNWKLNNLHPLITNKELIDQWYWRIQRKCDQQVKRQQKIIQYFKGLQFTIYSTVKLNQEDEDLEIQSWIETNQIQTLETNRDVKDAMLSFQNEMNALITRFEKIENTIESDLLKNTIENSLTLHNQNLQIILEESKKKNNAFVKGVQNYQKLYNKFFHLIYSKKVQEEKKVINHYDEVYMLLKQIYNISENLKSYSTLFKHYYEEIKRREIIRFSAIKKTFSGFVKIISETLCCGMENQLFKSSQILFEKIDENSLMEHFLRIEALLTLEEQKMLIRKYEVKKWQNFLFDKFIEDIGCEQYQEVINFFQIKTFEGKFLKGFLQSNPQVRIVLSTDHFLSVYKIKQEFNDEKIVSFPIYQYHMKIDKGRRQLHLYYKEKGLLWNKQQKLLIQMNENKLEELFSHYEHFIDIHESKMRLKKERKEFEKTKTLSNEQFPVQMSLDEFYAEQIKLAYSSIKEGLMSNHQSTQDDEQSKQLIYFNQQQ